MRTAEPGSPESAVRPGNLADVLLTSLLTVVIAGVGWLGVLLAPVVWPLSRLGLFRWLVRSVTARWPQVLRGDIVRLIEPGSRVLDVGAGDGSLGRAIARARAADVTGVDTLDRRPRGIRLVVTDGQGLPFPDREFDVVVLSYVLHHNVDPGPLLAECRRVCRGRVIVAEDELRFGRRFFQWGHHRLFNPLLPMRGRIVYRYPSEWRRLFRKHGLVVLTEQSRRGILSTPLRRHLFVLAPDG
jgi:ubiquinone/menaquinone biosynthesis C-methylase UbiE